jgi:hypothetical protein
MASWRCPHCGSPQKETVRCWVCHRYTTSCASCLHFRRSIAGDFGYCALDKGRAALTGDEERACWQPRAAEVEGEADDASEEKAVPAAAGGGGLWDAIAPTETAPDSEARVQGMWTESDSIRDQEAPAHQHGSSIRSKPWGPVPGLREPTGWRRGIRSATRKG